MLKKESEEIGIASVSRRPLENVCAATAFMCVPEHKYIIILVFFFEKHTQNSGLYTCAHFIKISYGLSKCIS
jgi:hypothetical protein